MNRIKALSLLIIILTFLIAAYCYPKMPSLVASHWNAQGQVDGYMSKFWGLFLFPFILGGLFLFFSLIPRIDPLKENIEKFRKYYDLFILFFILFFFYLEILVVLWNLGYEFEMNQFMPPAFGLLFFYLGILMEKAKRNWFIGIRTPRTLSSDLDWERTYKIGAKLFKIAAITTFLGFLCGDLAKFFLIVPVILASGYTIVFSYFEYQKEVRKK